ncbi:MAG: hypothetical protein KIT83_21505, partial [Bryobacterales bacterium]|nr:hypothetical protein [Bryobacterales bacterium]
RFRFCVIAPGNYRLTAMIPASPGRMPYGAAELDFVIHDRDIAELPIEVAAPVELSGRIVWEANPPEKQMRNPVTVSLDPLYRPPWINERRTSSSVPVSEFTLAVPPGAYWLRAVVREQGVYVKGIRFGDQDVACMPLVVGAGSGSAHLEVVLATGGAQLTVRVAKPSGAPITRGFVNVFPADVPSEAELADRALSTPIDAKGIARFPTALAPGIYRLVPTKKLLDLSPQSMAELRKRLNNATKVELSPGESGEVRLEWNGQAY